MNIFVIRHGHTGKHIYNEQKQYPDPALDETGRRQAALTGERLKRYGIERLYCADLDRTRTTAEIINTHLGAELFEREELREINMGEVHTLGWDNVMEAHPDFKKAFDLHETDVPYPGGECGGDVFRRAMCVIDELAACNLENVVLVTSGGTIRSLVSGILGLGQEKRFLIDPHNCGISIIRYDREHSKFYIRCVNDTAHLEAENLCTV